MNNAPFDSEARLASRVARFAPGLAALLAYRRADLPSDLIAGLSVAAVALPVGVAYAQLAGFSPVAGLHASILPMATYTLFGTSRQLFKQQAQAAIRRAGPDLRWFLLDALPITQLDVTGYVELEYLSETLRRQGAELVLAGRWTESNEIRRAKGVGEIRLVDRHFPTMRQAIKAYRSTHLRDLSVPPEEG